MLKRHKTLPKNFVLGSTLKKKKRYLAWKAPFEGQNGNITFEPKARCIQRSRNLKVTEFLLLKVVPPIMHFLNLAKKWLIA